MKLAARIARFAALALVVMLGTAEIAAACPSCQQALAEGSQGDLARGIYYSILFMMSMPFAITLSVGGLMYRAVKREQRRVAALSASEASKQSEASASSDAPTR